MKNVIASIIIFIGLIIGMLFCVNYIEKTCDNYSKQIYSLEILLINDAWEDAYKLSNDIFYDWLEDRQTMSIFINHNHTDDVQVELLKLTQFTKSKDKSNALSSVHVLKFLIDDIVDFQKLSIQNIF